MIINSSTLTEAMAGMGDPRSILTPLRKQILFQLHQNPDPNSISQTLSLTSDQVKLELQSLAEFSLLTQNAIFAYPEFLIVDRSEVQLVLSHASQLADKVTQYVKQVWHQIKNHTDELSSIENDDSFQKHAFFLVGDRLLDIKLLDALASTSFMPPPPLRPSPKSPLDRYYFWMIEGSVEQRGKYGQRTTELSDDNWYLFTFGKYFIQNEVNKDRIKLESKVKVAVSEHGEIDSAKIGNLLGITTYSQQNCIYWDNAMSKYADNISNIILEVANELQQLHSQLYSSTYYETGFAEFICWYDHVMYAYVIDQLVDLNLITIPSSQFVATIWYEDIIGKVF